jgi:hypothetical protein
MRKSLQSQFNVTEVHQFLVSFLVGWANQFYAQQQDHIPQTRSGLIVQCIKRSYA